MTTQTNEMYRKVSMRTDCDCMVACLAMLLQCSYEAAAQFFPAIAINKRGYNWEYLTPFLKANGIYLNWMPSYNEVKWDKPAMLDVSSLTAPDKGDHIIFWDGEKVIDPSNKELKYTEVPTEINCAYQINENWTKLPLTIEQPEAQSKLTDADIHKWAELESELNYPSERTKRIIFRVGLSRGAKAMRDGLIHPSRSEHPDINTSFFGNSGVNFMQSTPATFDDYMKCSKEELITMLLERHRIMGLKGETLIDNPTFASTTYPDENGFIENNPADDEFAKLYDDQPQEVLPEIDKDYIISWKENFDGFCNYMGVKTNQPQEKISETVLRNTYTNQKGVTVTELPEPQEAKQPEWNTDKVIDFVNWYLRLCKVIDDNDCRFELENQTIIDSFLNGDDYRLWWNKGKGYEQESKRTAVHVLCEVYGCKEIEDLKEWFIVTDTSLAMIIEAMEKYRKESLLSDELTLRDKLNDFMKWYYNHSTEMSIFDNIVEKYLNSKQSK